MSGSLHYRPEIDGLRTVAVLAVIAYHLEPNWLKGGFLGVDVFFVISGFLITTIVFGQIQRGDFSLLKFWKRRIKRLYPAMVTMVGIVLFVGGFLLIRPERTELPKQAIAAVFSFENLWLWRTTGGYWDSSSEDIALLHTWSLSLEEQFYVCLPLLLLVVHRFMRGREAAVLAGLLAVSFGLCVGLTPGYRSAAFYFLPTRMWELLIGSLYAVLNAGRPMRTTGLASILQIVGLALIVGSYFCISQDIHFPSFYPIFACVGTLFIIMFGAAPGFIHSVLSLAPVVYLGKISYSLYLWHWPIIVFLKYLHPVFQPWLALALTFPAAILSYHLVENRFRERIRISRFELIIGTVLLAGCSAPILLLPGSPLVRGLGNIDSPAAMTRGWEFEATRKILDFERIIPADSIRPDVCVVGSSHARVLCRPIFDYCKAKKLKFESLVTSGIGITTMSPTHDVSRINEARLLAIEQRRPRIVILAGNWDGEATQESFLPTLEGCLRSISRSAEQVIVVGQVPSVSLPAEYRYSMRKLLVANSLSGASTSFDIVKSVAETNAKTAQVVEDLKLNNVNFANPHDLFVGPDGKIAFVINGCFVYSDDNHINDQGAKVVFERLLLSRIERAVAQEPGVENSKQAISSALRQ